MKGKKKKVDSILIFETWLNLDFTYDLTVEQIADMESELKIARKHRNKIKKLRDRATAEYERITGTIPTRKRGKYKFLPS